MHIPKQREPTHPGEMLLEEFLIPMEMSQSYLAIAIRMPYPIINDLINKKREITPSIALRLAKFLGMSEDFWINLQLRWDLYNAKRSEEVELQLIKQFRFQKLPTVHPEALVISGIRA
jgi:addiction module HigA family antidote